ncbi:MAG: stage V sporulation protein AC [Clostridiales bacterium]|nr:stage V sporulation protein AC [Clostridiales bacterium]
MDATTQKRNENYQRHVYEKMPKSTILKNCILAFLIGGAICTVGQGILNIGKNYYNLDTEHAAAFTSIIMIFLGAMLTGIGVYDDIGKVGGAGSIVPITGFSNSIVSPAMEFKREGYILGIGAKMFTIAGPVLVYGIGSSVLVGIIHHLFIK